MRFDVRKARVDTWREDAVFTGDRLRRFLDLGLFHFALRSRAPGLRGFSVVVICGNVAAMRETVAVKNVQPLYRVYQNFLGLRACADLLAWAKENRAKFEPTRVSSGRNDRRKSLRSELPESMAKMLRRHMFDLFPAVVGDLGIPHFEPSKIDSELVAHGDGAFFRRHSDRFYGLEPGANDRLLTAVYYFYVEPKAFSGGALRLYSSQSDEEECSFVDVWPEQNALLVFPSSASHEVLTVSCPSGHFVNSRFAVNLWICRRVKGGEDETAGRLARI